MLLSNQPKATLSSDQKDILTGDSVTLICTVESSGWRFYWYRHRQDSEPVATTSGSSYTLSQVSVSDGGQYRCRKLIESHTVERPVAVLTLQPNWTQIFKGETVPLRCVIKWGEDKDWEYKWFKESHSIYSKTNPEYTISPVNTSHTGSFTCLGVKENTFSRTSDAVQLTVSGKFTTRGLQLFSCSVNFLFVLPLLLIGVQVIFICACLTAFLAKPKRSTVK
uniref:Ig-like domain-containing protein n=1 Tax=Esox lucius TaxID=8010 RepID=A0AAY5K5F7_ESOLU